MNPRIGNSLTGKLLILIFFSLVITIVPLFLIVQGAFQRFGDYADTTNSQQIKHISIVALSALVTEQAQKYDQAFTRIKIAATLMAQTATDIYANLELYAASPIGKISLEQQTSNHIFFTPPSHPIITAFWGEQKISSDIQKEIQALSHLDVFLKKTRELIPESIATHIITTSGIGRYYTQNPITKKQCFNLPPPGEFDLRNGEPVQMFSKPGPRNYQAQWTNPYKDDVIDGFMMTAAAPIVDTAGNFLGIAGIDIPMASMVKDLVSEQTEENPGPKTILFGFLMDKNGRLIAFPEQYFTLFDIEIDTHQFSYSRDILNCNLSASKNPDLKKAINQILDSKTHLLHLNLLNETYVLASSRLSETGWHLVLVSREKNLLSSVHETRTALKKNLSRISGYYLLYSAIVLLMAILFIYLAVRLIIQPIKELTALTRRVSEGDLSMSSQIRRKDEIGILADAYNQMIAKIIQSEKSETAHVRALEKQANQLKNLNEHLVFSEELERKNIASDLHDSIAQTLAIGISKLKTITESENSIHQNELLELQGFLEQAIREIRSLIYNLSPPILDDFDIDIAIGFLIEESNEKHHTDFRYINNLEEMVDLKNALKVTLYRGIGELIANILKHAQTQTAEFEISATADHLLIRVEDKGCGMDLKRVEEMKGCGFGLYSISERMENFGGRMEIFSAPGQGTKILLTAPI
ncbi:MAG: HAMP domain-containing protein [Proteobacteria bacterium]|nr:HAMP domain-containing protein [Pseudomonadota bacterium]